ncbi:PLP-dependent transferase [Labilibaculum antarcticum]|uniref:Cystathionine beta-lyase n=1 Tax=Labilibaculum antarcticum TaxID=1717717 RepID=A0A1Y1CLR8_9BACT|nr:PLP-dependent transferase [Labilibaculum antarcticum]BAX81346.1 hypothetical protein ALGA_3041 [Labilibaculum antarcticum]
MLETTNIRELSKIAKANHCLLVVDNTFSPLIFTPAQEGVDAVVHSLTKFINGMSDCVAIPYPGLETPLQYQLINAMAHKNYGSGGLFAIDLKEIRYRKPIYESHTKRQAWVFSS